MNKTLIVIISLIFALFVIAGLAYLAVATLASPAVTATPTLIQFPTTTATATLTPSQRASATPTLTRTPRVTRTPTMTRTSTPTQTPTATAVATTTTPVKTATPAPTGTRRPTTATPTANPATASVSVSDQPLGAGNTLVVARVVSPVQGWIVIYNDEGGHPGAVLGYAPVSPGQNNNVKVTLTATTALPGTAWAVLLVDGGAIGTFEFPGADMPYRDSAGNFAQASFKVTQ